ncbi:predicted protein [Nematostella vectensis]|uniref:Dynein light chain n=1 Tax=Nematostella vectensis TaxID=45351 RepID=A7RR15_NEMVE|nr:predicted protein [Nematostella vectensis]|eukprot:XP_001638152.1 predicted protein [Nematostella vectensis]
METEERKKSQVIAQDIELGKRFSASIIENISKVILQERLEGMSYEATECSKLAREMSETIRNEVKALSWDRYKIVVMVSIGSLKDQGLHISSRCLWYPNTDGSATAVYRNTSLFAVATVFGIYVE